MEELHTIHTKLGHVVIAVDPEARTVKWVEPIGDKKPYTTRQSASRRRKQIQERETIMYNPFDDPNYCGYCKCSPCQCDGHGNFGEQENVSWYPTELDENTNIPGMENQEGPLTNENGTPYEPEPHSRQLRTDNRSPKRSWRPQRR